MLQDSFNNITESYLPRYRKGEFKHLLLNKRNKSTPVPSDHLKTQLGEGILHNFRALNGCVSNLDELFKARMEVHEEQIIQIAHSEIKKIQQQCEAIIKQYSLLIQQKNISQEILDLKYEVKYYQKRACQMFQENNQMRQHISNLQKQLDGYKIDQQTAHEALKNISKKYLKQKTIRKNIELSNQKRILFREHSVHNQIKQKDGNLRFSVLSKSALQATPEKSNLYKFTALSPTRQDSSTSKLQPSYFRDIKTLERNTTSNKQILLRVKTQPTREGLPTLKRK